MEGEEAYLQVRRRASSRPKQCTFDPEEPYVRSRKPTASLYVTNMLYNPVYTLLKLMHTFHHYISQEPEVITAVSKVYHSDF